MLTEKQMNKTFTKINSLDWLTHQLMPSFPSIMNLNKEKLKKKKKKGQENEQNTNTCLKESNILIGKPKEKKFLKPNI